MSAIFEMIEIKYKKKYNSNLQISVKENQNVINFKCLKNSLS